MKSIVFANRVGKEILRDPLSYIFCLAFPLLMLLIMSIVDSSIPAQANMTVFHIENLAPGIAYFGLTFVMLFTGIQVSRDRTTALLLRLYASPMGTVSYLAGYSLPVCLLGLAQTAICFAAASVVALCRGCSLSVTAELLSMLALLPSLLMFTGLGILFGCAVNEKAAPGLCSIIISAVGIVGGIWMDVDGLGGTVRDIARLLPFYHGVKLARLPFSGSASGLSVHLLWGLLSALLFYALALTVFSAKMKKDTQ